MEAIKRTGRAESGVGLARREEDKEDEEYRESLRSLFTNTNYNDFTYYVKNLSQIGLNSTRKGFGARVEYGTLQYFEIPTLGSAGKSLSEEGVTAQVMLAYNKDVVVEMKNSLSIANFGSTKQTYSDITGNSLVDGETESTKTNPQFRPKEFDTITIRSDISDTTFTYLIELKRA
ncbi:MAG: hypothetical protein KGH53_03830 [Candidatus Micrarchaeota archaeon]|nr:hypothetical protein [Candidatus Micrarchaeota archaeon]